MNRAYKRPKIGAILDIGSQGSLKDINAKNPFALFGISFDLPVYAGGRNKIKILEQEQEILSMVEQEEQIKNQLSLQVELTTNSYLASLKTIPAKQKQVETAKRYYYDVMKKYKEGQANYFELFESQTQITSAELQKSIAIYDAWIRFAEMERANASFSLK
jgi:outer membrane protein TolC